MQQREAKIAIVLLHDNLQASKSNRSTPPTTPVSPLCYAPPSPLPKSSSWSLSQARIGNWELASQWVNSADIFQQLILAQSISARRVMDQRRVHVLIDSLKLPTPDFSLLWLDPRVWPTLNLIGEYLCTSARLFNESGSQKPLTAPLDECYDITWNTFESNNIGK